MYNLNTYAIIQSSGNGLVKINTKNIMISLPVKNQITMQQKIILYFTIETISTHVISQVQMRNIFLNENIICNT